MDNKTSPIFNSKNGMFKPNKEGSTDGRSYYLLQIFGALINTQPFGGFNFTRGLAELYQTRDKFINEIIRLTNEYELFGVDGTSDVNKILEQRSSTLIQDNKKGNDSYATHGNSTGDVEVFKIIGKIVNEKGFCFSDTNNTKSKMNEITETNDIVQHHKTQLETNSGLNPGHYYFIMSKFKITKARSGGPIFNTQIYKSEPDPVTERDGMIGVFKKRWRTYRFTSTFRET